MALKKMKDGVTVLDKLTKIGYRFSKKPKGTFGVELETETKGDATGPHPDAGYPADFFKQDVHGRIKIPINGWDCHIDNSLRNFGREFVFSEPFEFKEALSALDLFGESTKGINFLKNTPSTSTHVHVNMLHEAPMTLANFLTIYTLLENVLVEYSGPSRRSNLFALPIRVAEQTLENLMSVIDVLDQETSRGSFSSQNAKYAAINVAPLLTFGSVEIRSFRGETDMKEVKTWLTMINMILEYAKEASTPFDILCEYRDKSVSILEEIFSPPILDKILQKVVDAKMLIDINLWSTYRLATHLKDWESINQMKVKEKKIVGDSLVEQYASRVGISMQQAMDETSGMSAVQLQSVVDELSAAPLPAVDWQSLVGNPVTFTATIDSSTDYVELEGEDND